MKKETLNVFEIIGKINKEFGNHVYIPRSFPSIDTKLTYDGDNDVIKIKSYDDSEPECPVGYLTISWKRDDEEPIYHFVSYTEQTSDKDTVRYDEMDYESTDIRHVVTQLLQTIVGDDEPTHDEEPDCWKTGKYPDEYFDECFENYTGIFEGVKNKKLVLEWS